MHLLTKEVKNSGGDDPINGKQEFLEVFIIISNFKQCNFQT